MYKSIDFLVSDTLAKYNFIYLIIQQSSLKTQDENIFFITKSKSNN